MSTPHSAHEDHTHCLHDHAQTHVLGHSIGRMLDAPEREALARRGRRLGFATVGVASLEAVVGVVAGVLASSAALVGFGADSVIEVTAALAALWRLRAELPYAAAGAAESTSPRPWFREVRARARRERIEKITLRLIGASFIALAIYVALEAAHDLILRTPPATSAVGIGVAIMSLVLMPVLARAKRSVASGLGSAALTAEARQTSLCAYLSGVLLVGLTLHTLFGWWWADPVAALVMVPIIVREGMQALRGETCCDAC